MNTTMLITQNMRTKPLSTKIHKYISIPGIGGGNEENMFIQQGVINYMFFNITA
jgi:hypothetical protein